jgi:hypothetical protein
MDSDPSELFKTSNSYFEGFPTQSEWQFMTSFSGNLQSEPSECPTHMPEDGLPRQHHCTNASMDSVRPKPSASRPAANELLRVLDAYNPQAKPDMVTPETRDYPMYGAPQIPSVDTFVSLIPPTPQAQWPLEKDLQRLREATQRQLRNGPPPCAPRTSPQPLHNPVVFLQNGVNPPIGIGPSHILVAVPIPYVGLGVSNVMSPTQLTVNPHTIWSPGPSPSSSSELLSNQSGVNHPPGSATVDSTKYKTSMCRNFQRQGICPYGEVCVYAHGENELRNVNENSVAVQSLCKLADQLASKHGPVSLHSLGPLRYRKKKNKKTLVVGRNDQQLSAMQ